MLAVGIHGIGKSLNAQQHWPGLARHHAYRKAVISGIYLKPLMRKIGTHLASVLPVRYALLQVQLDHSDAEHEN